MTTRSQELSCRTKGPARTCHLGTPAQRSLGLQALKLTLCTYLVATSIVTFINSNNTISKMSQSVQAVGPLLQGPKSYVLMVGDPGKQR